jgi:hypothetical protein
MRRSAIWGHRGVLGDIGLDVAWEEAEAERAAVEAIGRVLAKVGHVPACDFRALLHLRWPVRQRGAWEPEDGMQLVGEHT